MPGAGKTRFAILGLLSWKPMSGYDIKKLVDVGLSYFWSESYGQLYPTLDGLVREGLARKRRGAGRGRRSRNLYAITPKGQEAFVAWLRRPSDIPRARNEIQLKFFLSSRAPLAESIRLLQEYRRQQREVRELYAESEAILRAAVREGSLPGELEEVLADEGTDPATPAGDRANEALIFLLTLRHGILAVEARLAWCEEGLRSLRRSARNRKRPRGKR